MAGGLAFRWSLRKRNDNLPVPLCPKRKVCGRCRSFGNGRSLSGRCEIVMLSDFMLLLILIELPFIDNCSNREVYVHFLLNLKI